MPLPIADHLIEKNSHLIDDISQHQQLVERANQYAIQHDLLRIPAPVLDGDVVTLEADQTSFKDQGSRGTCFAFATCAAMEAAYKRKYGIELDLSEQFAFHLNKGCELHSDYMSPGTQPHENNSSYWGFQGCSDMVDKVARVPIPSETVAPYVSGDAWEQIKASTPCGQLVDGASSQEEVDAFEYDERHIPTASRMAARYRVVEFAALGGNPTPEQIESVIRGGHEVVADVPGHCTLIVGFDRPRRMYKIKNSWNEGTFIESSYDSTTWPIIGGRYIIDVDAQDAPPSWEAFWLGRWHMDHDGWHGDLVIRRTTDFRNKADDPTKLGDYYRDGKRYAVNGVTSQDGQALHFWVADTTDKVTPGTPAGQEFWAYVYSRDDRRAAGTTTWSDSRYGVTLSRDDLTGHASAGFAADAWCGHWSMDHDGWQGSLSISSVNPFRATYRANWDGTEVPVVGGGLTSGTDHYLEFALQFFPGNAQDFRLYGHTREDDVFSGITLWGGRVYGVQGHRSDPVLKALDPHTIRQAREYPRLAVQSARSGLGWTK